MTESAGGGGIDKDRKREKVKEIKIKVFPRCLKVKHFYLIFRKLKWRKTKKDFPLIYEGGVGEFRGVPRLKK